ncbi:MAG: lipid II:glycine glycyltransferase FemX [Anaerolineae bacterium]
MGSVRGGSAPEVDLSPSKDGWDRWTEAKGGHLLQSYGWGELKAGFGWRPHRVRIAADDGGAAAAQVLIRSWPWGSMAYVPRGPVADPRDDEALNTLLLALHQVARRERAIWLRLEPDAETASGWRDALLRHGFQEMEATFQPRSTLNVNLNGDEETILARMKSKTRYNIRLSERKGVRVREGGEADLPHFHRLLMETSRRDGFFIRDLAYYRAAWEEFSPSGRCVLLMAEYDGEMLAGLMTFAYGHRAWYLYGASSGHHREVMPNHLLQWAAMRWARERGCKAYDLWGIPDEVGRSGEPEDFATRRGELWGVYRFKRGFGGRPVRFEPAYEYVYRPRLYRLLMLAGSRLRPTVRGLWEGF